MIEARARFLDAHTVECNGRRITSRRFIVATGSTCALGGTDVSPSLLAMGLSPRRAASTVRVSPGPGVSVDDAERAGRTLAEVVERLRALARR